MFKWWQQQRDKSAAMVASFTPKTKTLTVTSSIYFACVHSFDAPTQRVMEQWLETLDLRESASGIPVQWWCLWWPQGSPSAAPMCSLYFRQNQEDYQLQQPVKKKKNRQKGKLSYYILEIFWCDVWAQFSDMKERAVCRCVHRSI